MTKGDDVTVLHHPVLAFLSFDPMPLFVPESVSPLSPVCEFLQRPLDVHSVSHACHSQVQEIILGERRQM